MAKQPFSEEELQDIVNEMNTSSNVESARLVEFMGELHAHADLVNGDIVTVWKDGRVVPIDCSQE